MASPSANLLTSEIPLIICFAGAHILFLLTSRSFKCSLTSIDFDNRIKITFLKKGDKMETIKIMPCLDMKEGRVVKGVHFVDIKDAGDPVENAAFYEKEGADELAMLDIAATVENRKTRLEWGKNVSSVIHIPLTVGGGISTLEDIELVLKAGADEFSMNSAAVKNSDLVKQASKKFGKDKITIAIDARRNKSMPSGFELVVSGGTNPVGKDAIAC